MMAKVVVQFSCSECGTTTGRWLGKCPGCGAFGTLVEELQGRETPSVGAARAATPTRLADVKVDEARRMGTGVTELDRVLGGGLVPASLVLVGGEPGVGKSTLLLSALGAMARAGRRTLLVTGEESVAQVKLRATRLGGADDVEILAETELETVCATLAELRPDVCVIDSVQTLYASELGSAPGSVAQVREAAGRMLRVSKENGVATILVGHVTKDGAVAGPRVLEHLVDCVLQFEGDRYHAHRVLRAVKKRSAAGRFRLAVDRSFTLAGHGTAVTGTVVSGTVAVDDTVMLSPSGISARIRSINAQNRPVQRGEAGTRCALVLSGPEVSKDRIKRGEFALDPALHAPTQRVDARLRILGSETKPIGQWFPVKVHHAAAEVPGRIVVLRDGALSPGEEDFVQLVLERPIAAASGDRFVVRDTTSSRTIGGGTLVDVHAPERKRRTADRRAVLEALSRPDARDALSALLAPPGAFVDLDAFARDRALSAGVVEDLVQASALMIVPHGAARIAFSAAHWEEMRACIGEAVDALHKAQPDQPGLGIEHLRRLFKPMLQAPVFISALRRLGGEGWIALDRTWVRRPQHQARLSEEEERLLKLLLARIAEHPFRPPRVRDMAKAMNIEESFVRRLLRLAARRGDVEEIAQDHFFTRPVVSEMARIAIDIAAASPSGSFTAADFRDRLDNGRKVAIQILEFFDRHGLTLRRADLRRINPHRMRLFAPAAPPITSPQRDRNPR